MFGQRQPHKDESVAEQKATKFFQRQARMRFSSSARSSRSSYRIPQEANGRPGRPRNESDTSETPPIERRFVRPSVTASGLLVVTLKAILLTAAAGCQVPVDMPGPSDQDGSRVLFSDQIQPILNTYCFRCHRPGGEADLAGIALQVGEEVAFDLLVNQPSSLDPSLTLVVPGDAESSLLFLKVASDAPPTGERMPLREAPLSAGSIELIRDWIDQGALDN